MGLFSTIGTTECYQETANIATSCGGLSTGSYFIDTTKYFYINYTKPYNALSSIWQVKFGYYFSNITIPSSCFDYSSNLQLRLHSYAHVTPPVISYGQCFNGAWINITSISSSYCGRPACSWCNCGYQVESPAPISRLYDEDYSTNLVYEDYSDHGWRKCNSGDCLYASIYEEAIIWQIQSTCNTSADTNCDGIVDRTELGIYITKWINNQVTREELGQAIVAWIGGV